MISGRYVKTFAEGNMGMLEGANLNAPYRFHWLYVQRVVEGHIECTGADEPMRLRITRKGDREQCKVTVHDPIFGPTEFPVAPFLGDHAPPVGDEA